MVEFIKMTCRKYSEQENQNRTEQKLLKVEALFYLVKFLKLVFRQSNIVCTGILYLIVKTNSLAIF